MSVMGRVPTYFRPPYGSCGAECLALLQEYGYHAVREPQLHIDYDADESGRYGGTSTPTTGEVTFRSP